MVTALTLATMLGVVRVAHAQQPSPPQLPRARLAGGGVLGGAFVPGWHGGGGPGGYLRGGVQLSELFGLNLQGTAATVLFAGAARGALTADFAVRDWLSLGTGASIQAFYRSRFFFSRGHDGILYGLPLRVAFHLGHVRRETGGRAGLELMFEGDVGIASGEPVSADVALAGYLCVGYAVF